MKLSPTLMALVLAVRKAGGRPYLVGGSVRDHIMWRGCKDIDLEVYGLAPDALAHICAQFGAVNAVGKSFGVLVLNIDGMHIDVSVPRTESKIGVGHRGFMVTPSPNMTEKDAAARRDFTMNSLLMDPITKEIIDHYEGRNDIEHGVLHATSNAYTEDPLRVLRGMQFASRFQMIMDDYTANLSFLMKGEYSSLPIERIWIEWEKWALGRFPSYGLKVLKQTHWDALYPALNAMQDTRQDKEWHPEGTVWQHTLHTVDAAAMIAVREKLSPEDRKVLVFAALCHDMGKITTTVIDLITDRVTSPGHAEEGVFFAGKFMQRIGAPEAVQARVLSLVGEHMWAASGNVTQRAVRRLAHRLSVVGNTVKDLSYLVEADNSGRPPLQPGLPVVMKIAVNEAEEMRIANSGPVPIMMGRHLIAMGFKPSPIFTSILHWCFEQQLEGNLTSVEVGEEMIREQQSHGAWKYLA